MLKWFRKQTGQAINNADGEPPTLNPADVAQLLVMQFGLPQIDWALADQYIISHAGHRSQTELRRAIVQAWLDDLRETLDEPHEVWRIDSADGLTPGDARRADNLKRATQQSIAELEKSLAVIRGHRPMAPFAIVAIKPLQKYVSFYSHFTPDGAWATNGGCYISALHTGYPIIAVNGMNNFAGEHTIAHELTHHALADCHLPLWAEEGITQMMEERIVGVSNFTLTHERRGQHLREWIGGGMDEFISGYAFVSPNDERQQLAYHLSQWVVRRSLDERRESFLAFIRACATQEDEAAAQRYLGMSQADYVRELAGLPI